MVMRQRDRLVMRRSGVSDASALELASRRSVCHCNSCRVIQRRNKNVPDSGQHWNITTHSGQIVFFS